MTESSNDVLDRARVQLGISQEELWIHYFELGGMSSAIDVEAYLAGILEPSPHDHDLIAHTLNEFFTDRGGDHPIPYLADSAEESGEKGTEIENRVESPET